MAITWQLWLATLYERIVRVLRLTKPFVLKCTEESCAHLHLLLFSFPFFVLSAFDWQAQS